VLLVDARMTGVAPLGIEPAPEARAPTAASRSRMPSSDGKCSSGAAEALVALSEA